MPPIVNRRKFLATTSGAVAAFAAFSSGAASARVDRTPMPTGPVAGRTDERGIAPGTARDPSRGQVVLLDGRVIDVTHPGGIGIAPGRSVLIAPEADGSWSILYAELSA